MREGKAMTVIENWQICLLAYGRFKEKRDRANDVRMTERVTRWAINTVGNVSSALPGRRYVRDVIKGKERICLGLQFFMLVCKVSLLSVTIYRRYFSGRCCFGCLSLGVRGRERKFLKRPKRGSSVDLRWEHFRWRW